VRGVRQRRPSAKVNKHRDARSFLCVTAERPTLLREDIEVSLEFEFWIACRREPIHHANREIHPDKPAGWKRVGVPGALAGKPGLQRGPENRNAPARPGRSDLRINCTTRVIRVKVKIVGGEKSQNPHPKNRRVLHPNSLWPFKPAPPGLRQPVHYRRRPRCGDHVASVLSDTDRTFLCWLQLGTRPGVPSHQETSQPGLGRFMKRANHTSSYLGDFNSGATLGGEVSRYQDKQSIYRQGEPAETLFYIQKGAVRLSTRRNNRPSAVTAILGVGDFFGELCLADYPPRMSTAVALTDSSIRTIKKEKMLQLIRKSHRASNSFVAHLLSSVKKYRDQVADLLTSSADQRLAHVLLQLAHLGRNGRAVVEIPFLSHKVLAEMVGTTRSRVNVFMNRFRKQGFINYGEGIEVRPSLRKVVRKR
jgi:CRP/FNR family cyclic AMP-dependent transcriptional regulator